jgi:predicted nucleotidyltransferase
MAIHPLITQNLDAIRQLCREFGVARLEVFGSAATGEFDPTTSDVDFIVEYPPGYEFGLWLTRYFELQERLEALLGRPVDLVMAGAPRNPYFIRSLNESRQLLYAA